MSETTTPTEEAPPPVEEAPVTTEVADQAPAEETPSETPQEPEKKPRRADRHVANLTARLAATQAELAELQRRADAAEALINAGKEKTEEAPRRGETVEQAAERLLAEKEFARQRQSVIDNGAKEFGQAAWDEKASVLHGFGATTNAAFMEALIDLPNAPKIVAELADDTDTLVALLKKSPAAMAAQLGRMDARMETPVAPKPALSSAPKPPAPVAATKVLPEPSIYDEKLSMKEWAALREKTAPRHLGGRR